MFIIICLFIHVLTFFPSFIVATTSDTNNNNGPIIGIDFGSATTRVAVFHNGTARVIHPPIPSVVSFSANHPDQWSIGDNRSDTSSCAVHNIKRIIGRGFSDALPHTWLLGDCCQIMAQRDNKPFIRINSVPGRDFSPEEITSMILQKAREVAEQYLETSISRAVVTVPCHFNDEQRQAIKNAGNLAGLTIERLINEPTSAAIAYGLDKLNKEMNVLVFDMGSRSFHVTMLGVDFGFFDLLATNGDDHLGGEDFTDRVVAHLLEEFQSSHPQVAQSIEQDKAALHTLRKEAERAKKVLSHQLETRIEIASLHNGLHLHTTLNRSIFEALNQDLFSKITHALEHLLKEANLTREQVDEIILVGGSSHMPRIQDVITHFFNGKQPLQDIAPRDEVVAMGAAMVGHILEKDVEPLYHPEFSYLSMGVEVAGGSMKKIIPRGTLLPARKTQLISMWPQKDGEDMSIRVFMGDRVLTKDNVFLGELTSGIPTSNFTVLEVTFVMDEDNVLHVTARDITSVKEHGAIITGTVSTGLDQMTPQEIDQMIRDANEEDDGDRWERTDVRNELEVYVYQLKMQLIKDENVVEKKIMMEDEIEGVISWLKQHQDGTVEEFGFTHIGILATFLYAIWK